MIGFMLFLSNETLVYLGITLILTYFYGLYFKLKGGLNLITLSLSVAGGFLIIDNLIPFIKYLNDSGALILLLAILYCFFLAFLVQKINMLLIENSTLDTLSYQKGSLLDVKSNLVISSGLGFFIVLYLESTSSSLNRKRK